LTERFSQTQRFTRIGVGSVFLTWHLHFDIVPYGTAVRNQIPRSGLPHHQQGNEEIERRWRDKQDHAGNEGGIIRK